MRNTEMPQEALNYIQNLFLPEDKTLLQVRQTMRDLGKEGMSISAVEAGILQLLIQMNHVRSVVEIGTFAGYSAIQMARALPKDGKLYTLEFEKKHYQVAQENISSSDVKDKIEILEGVALENLKTLEDKGPFDLVFIDADKGNYVEYLNWAEKHVRKGGVIIGDNTFLFGSVYQEQKPSGESMNRWQVMREFNQRLADANKYKSILIPTSEGMTVALKNF